MLPSDFPKTPDEVEAAESLRSRMNVGRLIVRWRMRLGLTQDELARRAHTKQSRISELEGLRGNVRFDTLDKITRALGLEITLQPRGSVTVSVAAADDDTVRVVDRSSATKAPATTANSSAVQASGTRGVAV
jgi:transcriptional regulator with XRE-family HTH domain